jgi:branched-chain amino acid aminotransferase
MQCHLDGKLVDVENASVGVTDRGFQFGDGFFGYVRVYGATPFAWKTVAEHLSTACNALSIPAPDGTNLHERVRETVVANDLTEALVRVTVTRGKDPTGDTRSGWATVDLAGPDRATPTVLVTAHPRPRGGLDGDRVWTDPATVQTVKARRPAHGLPEGVRTTSHLPTVLARRQLVAGADEALVRAPDGTVVGGTDSTPTFVTEEGVHVPELDGPVLDDATREVVLDCARENGVPVVEGRYDPEDYREAREAALVSPDHEVRPVDTVDGIAVGGGPVVDLLSRAFDRRVEAACYD